MTAERNADLAQQLGDRILDAADELMHDAPAGEAAQVVALAGLGAFVALVAAAGGTREAATMLVEKLLPAICDDVFAPEG